MGIYFEGQVPESPQRSPLGGFLDAVLQEGIDKKAELSGGHFSGIKEPDGSGGRVAGVGEGRLALFLPDPVEGFKGPERQIDFSPDLDLPFFIDEKRETADCSDITRYVVSFDSVSARDRPGQFSVMILDGYSYTVDLELHDVLDFFSGEKLPNAVFEFPELSRVETIVDAQHGRAVQDGVESFDGFFADALGR
jgi:hypothetical protein